MNEVLNAIRDRRSTRGFENVQLTEAELQALIDAALQAPTARNTQYWHFSVVQNGALLDEFSRDAAALSRAGKPAGSRGRFDEDDFHIFYHAPTVIFISHPAECDNGFMEVDCGIAVQNLALAAQSMGMGSVIIGMAKGLFNSERGAYYRDAFEFPKDHVFSIAIAVGHNTVTKEAHDMHPEKVSVIR